MNLLITPREVAEIAFAGSPAVTEERIGEATIIAAQTKFVKPVIGTLYAGLQKGEYPELLPFIKAALAQYVKLLLIPQMAVSTGNIGIVQAKAGHFSPAGHNSVAALKRAARSEACAMMHRAIEHIEANPDTYQDYVADENVLNRVSICSGIVL